MPADRPTSADGWMDTLVVDPIYEFSHEGKLSPVWEHSEQLRTALRNRGRPAGKDRQGLANALLRQVSTVELFRQVVELPKLKVKDVTLYVILFPGEGRDNTGIKDLNDKVIGYEYNQKFIEARIQKISEVFWDKPTTPPPRFATVGADYKTALVLALGKSRVDFKNGLAELDKKLQHELLVILDQAEKDPATDKAKIPEIKKTRKAVERKGYKFDFYYGAAPLNSQTRSVLERSFLMVTEALKGAGIARMIAKSRTAATKLGRGLARSLKSDPDKYDNRGKAFDHGAFIRVLKIAGDIKDKIVRNAAWLYIWVDKVWTVCLFEYRRNVFVMNPDVVRDARKKKLERPGIKQGMKYKKYFLEQKDLLEGWLVAINALDYIKDFLTSEFKKAFLQYHMLALEAFEELQAKHDGEGVKWARLEKLLTRDMRQGPSPIPIHGRSSEFLFYANASDNEAQIFLSMDIRDLGIHVALLCDWWAGWIEVQQQRGVQLMMETFKVSDLINARRRVTYDAVVKAFRDVFPRTNSSSGVREASKAFDGTLSQDDRPGSFEDSVQVMLGGDEIFVAAHPCYTAFICEIVGALRRAEFEGIPLDMRTGVAFSRARKGRNQKRANWEAHDQGHAMATRIMDELKKYERAHRRMERLIEKLEANPKKDKLAPPLRKELEALGLTKMYIRYKWANPWPVDARQFRYNLEHVAGNPDNELVGADCRVVDEDDLVRRMKQLEGEIIEKVGLDNYYMDPPPFPTKMPGWIKWIFDMIDKMKEIEEDEDKKQRERERGRQRPTHIAER